MGRPGHYGSGYLFHHHGDLNIDIGIDRIIGIDIDMTVVYPGSQSGGADIDWNIFAAARSYQSTPSSDAQPR